MFTLVMFISTKDVFTLDSYSAEGYFHDSRERGNFSSPGFFVSSCHEVRKWTYRFFIDPRARSADPLTAGGTRET